MAFMALFGWIFIPIILFYFLLQMILSPLAWAAEHSAIVNAAAVCILAFNVVLLALLVRWRRRRKRAGQSLGICSLLAILWEVWVIFWCGVYLAVQPLRFLPTDFGKPYAYATEDSFGTWEVTGVQAKTPGCTQTQEEINALMGLRITYEEDAFQSGDQAWHLKYMEYKSTLVRDNSFPMLYSMQMESLGIDKNRMWRTELNATQSAQDANPLGLEFYVVDNDTILLYRKGVFFRAERRDAVPIAETAFQLPEDPNAPVYFGDWKIQECLGTAENGPMEPEMIEKTIGAFLTYGAYSIWFERKDFGGGAGEPVYEEREITPEDFAQTYGVTLEDLGLESGTYLHVQMEVWSSEPFFEDLGGRFLVLNEEEMLICSKGAFFLAKKDLT